MTAWTLSTNPARRFISLQLFGLAAPMAAGLILYGWRAILTTLLVVTGAMLGWAVWRHVGRRGHHMPWLHTLWLAVLLSALLPAHLASWGVALPEGPAAFALWPILPAAGLLLAGLNWLLGGTAGGRINPALATLLLLIVMLGPAMVPHLSLRREAAVTGDLLDYRTEPLAELSGRSWARGSMPEGSTSPVTDAVWRGPASQRLGLYTSGIERPDRRQFTLQALLRDRMPPMEDLIVLGQPSLIGTASAVATIAGGLFLVFRGVADVRISLVATAGAYITLLLAPVPESITRDGPVWTWAAVFRDDRVPWDAALTFVHYELLAGPILFIAMFLAPLPSLRPLAGRWRVIWASLLGPLMAASQLYASVAFGPFVALLLASLATPLFDRMTRAKTLV